MSEPRHIKDIILAIAADPEDELGQILRRCPFIQIELMKKGLMSFDDLTDEECDRLIEYDTESAPDLKHDGDYGKDR